MSLWLAYMLGVLTPFVLGVYVVWRMAKATDRGQMRKAVEMRATARRLKKRGERDGG